MGKCTRCQARHIVLLLNKEQKEDGYGHAARRQNPKPSQKKQGYTLDKLAELAESEQKSYIWELENKDPPRPSADKIAKIAVALGVTPDYLITDSVPIEDATDTAFFRKYRSQDPGDKGQDLPDGRSHRGR